MMLLGQSTSYLNTKQLSTSPDTEGNNPREFAVLARGAGAHSGKFSDFSFADLRLSVYRALIADKRLSRVNLAIIACFGDYRLLWR